MNKNTKSLFILVAIIAAFQGISALLGILTAQEIAGWYNQLNKSPLTPPGPTFGIAWTTLYLLLAVAFWRMWRKPSSAERKSILAFFLGHMILNWAWTPVFFTAHLVLPALILLVSIWVTAIILCASLRNHDKIAAWLFAPYILWLSFATYLNFYIWQHN